MFTKFKLFEAYNPNEIVLLRNSRKQIILKIERFEISNLNKLIIGFLDVAFRQYGYRYGKNNKTIIVNEQPLETEYLNKFVNNITLFGVIAERNNLKTKEQFISYIRTNMKDLYSPSGSQFIENYKIIENTAKKGKRGEEACKNNFEELLFNKTGLKINIEEPTDAEEDIKGIDGKFIFKNKLVTVQVKPFTKYEIQNNNIIVYSNGAMGFSTHYLLLYREHKIGIDQYEYDFISLINGADFNNILSNKGVYKTDVKNIINMSGVRLDAERYNL